MAAFNRGLGLKRTNRRLAAIVAADVAGYSRLVGLDEEGVLRALRTHRAEFIDPLIAEHGGRIANTAGDSLLLEFPSAVDALRCALELQAGMEKRNADTPSDRRIRFRIGVNVGDVVSEGDDLLGEGVNIAARLEGVAPAGGICLSRAARDQVRDRMPVDLDDLGEVQVKNIARPVRAFRVQGMGEPDDTVIVIRKSALRGPLIAAGIVLVVLAGGLAAWRPWETPPPAPAPASPELARAATPSIAVLPFANRSDDAGQDHFAAGISEDIATDLSKVGGLRVAASSAAARFAGGGADPRQVAQALAVDHLLEGSVRRAGENVRVTATLIDGATGAQLWAERYDREADDVFAIQSEIAEEVVAELSRTLSEAKLTRVVRRHTPDLRAYDLYIQGRAKRIPPTPENLQAALALFNEAMTIDPAFAGGYAGAAYVRILLYANGDAPDGGGIDNLGAALKLAEEAVRLDPEFGPAWSSLAEAYYRLGRFDDALNAITKAMQAAPSDSLMRASYGKLLGHIGRGDEGIKQIEIAMRMSPDSLPLLYFLGLNQRAAGEPEVAIETLLEHRNRLGDRVLPGPTTQLIAAYADAGRPDDARAEAARLLEAQPNFTTDLAARTHLYKDPADMERFRAALTAAGIPE